MPSPDQNRTTRRRRRRGHALLVVVAALSVVVFALATLGTAMRKSVLGHTGTTPTPVLASHVSAGASQALRALARGTAETAQAGAPGAPSWQRGPLALGKVSADDIAEAVAGLNPTQRTRMTFEIKAEGRTRTELEDILLDAGLEVPTLLDWGARVAGEGYVGYRAGHFSTERAANARQKDFDRITARSSESQKPLLEFYESIFAEALESGVSVQDALDEAFYATRYTRMLNGEDALPTWWDKYPALLAPRQITPQITRQELLLRDGLYPLHRNFWNQDRRIGVVHVPERWRRYHLLHVEDGRLFNVWGKPYRTVPTQGNIYVLGADNQLYAGPSRLEIFHHSSLLGGAPVLAAGDLTVDAGRPIRLDRRSGHYRPEKASLKVLTNTLSEQGLDLSNTKFGKTR